MPKAGSGCDGSVPRCGMGCALRPRQGAPRAVPTRLVLSRGGRTDSQRAGTWSTGTPRGGGPQRGRGKEAKARKNFHCVQSTWGARRRRVLQQSLIPAGTPHPSPLPPSVGVGCRTTRVAGKCPLQGLSWPSWLPGGPSIRGRGAVSTCGFPGKGSGAGGGFRMSTAALPQWKAASRGRYLEREML